MESVNSYVNNAVDFARANIVYLSIAAVVVVLIVVVIYFGSSQYFRADPAEYELDSLISSINAKQRAIRQQATSMATR